TLRRELDAAHDRAHLRPVAMRNGQLAARFHEVRQRNGHLPAVPELIRNVARAAGSDQGVSADRHDDSFHTRYPPPSKQNLSHPRRRVQAYEVYRYSGGNCAAAKGLSGILPAQGIAVLTSDSRLRTLSFKSRERIFSCSVPSS